MISPEEYKILQSFAQRIPANDSGAHNNLAVVFYNKGLYDEAIEELQKALQIDPNFILARNNLDIVLKKSGRLEEKVKNLIRAVEAEPFDEKRTLELADTYRKMNRYSQAIIFYKRVLDYNPGSYEAHFGLGTTLKALGKYDDALEEIKKAVGIKISPETYRILGEIYFNKGVVDLAIKNLQESLLLDSSSAEGHFLLGFALGEKGKMKESVEEIRKAIAINPALAQFEPNLPIEIKEHKMHWEFLKEQLGMPKTSVNEYQVHYNLGISYLNKGLFTESKRELDECLKLRNDDAELFTALGEVSIFLDRTDEALKYFQRSFELDFSSPRCANGLGVTYLKKNDYAKATMWFEKALGLEKNFAPAFNNLALAQLCEDKMEEAIKNYETAIRLGNQEAKFNLGMHYFKKGNYELSLKLFQGNTADDNFVRGLIYTELGRDDESLAAFKNTIAISPNYAGAYYNIGFTLMKLGKFEEGLSFIRKGMEIEPNYEKERRRLSMVPEFYEFGPYYVPQLTKEMLVEEVKEVFPKPEVPKAQDFIANAEDYLRKKEFEKALAMVDEAIKLEPELSKALIIKARILFQGDNTNDAIDLLSLYAKTHPEDIEILTTLAEMLKSAGQLKPAKEQYLNLLKLQNDNLEWLNELAEINYSLSEIDEALAIFNKIYSSDNKNIGANLGLAKVYLRKKALEKAKPYLDFLEKEQPGLYDFNLLAGIYWLEKNDRAKAEIYLRKAIELDPSKSLPYYHWGLVQIQKGEFDNACDNWKKALLLSPDEELATKISHCLNITMEMLEILKKEV